MKILVLGRSGQLATALAAAAAGRDDLRLRCASRGQADLSKPGSAARLISAERPDLVINAAAYTAVDRAESEPDAAFRLNAAAPAEAAAAANGVGAGFIHISTDYVFDGSGGRAWCEDDPVGPLNVYGRSKLAGEERVKEAHPGATILRTSWVYGPLPANFVATMLRLAVARDSLRVVDDQVGCPTHALDLAKAILALATHERNAAGMTVHAAGRQETTWAGFACGIFAASSSAGGPTVAVVPCASTDYPTPAARPQNSRLDCGLLRASFGIELAGWGERIASTVQALLDIKEDAPARAAP